MQGQAINGLDEQERGKKKGRLEGGRAEEGWRPWEGKIGKRESNRQTRGRWEGRRGEECQGARGRGVEEGCKRMRAGRVNFILIISCL